MKSCPTVASLLLACMAPCIAQAAAPVAEVTALRPPASVAGRAATLAVGDRLEAGAELLTGAGGRVRLRFVDGSTLVVGDSTRMTIENFEMAGAQRQSATLRLQQGLIGQKVEKAGSSSALGAWQVRTPTAVTAVRGTEFVVEVDGDASTSVNVQSGRVEVEAVQSAAGGGTRSLRPRSIVTLADPQAGSTQCSPDSGCSPAAAWSAERQRSARERLSVGND